MSLENYVMATSKSFFSLFFLSLNTILSALKRGEELIKTTGLACIYITLQEIQSRWFNYFVVSFSLEKRVVLVVYEFWPFKWHELWHFVLVSCNRGSQGAGARFGAGGSLRSGAASQFTGTAPGLSGASSVPHGVGQTTNDPWGQVKVW